MNRREGGFDRVAGLLGVVLATVVIGWRRPRLRKALVASVTAGALADDPVVIELARCWHVLVSGFSGGDAALAGRMREAYLSEPQVMAAQGM